MPTGLCETAARPLAEGCRILYVPGDHTVVARTGTVLGPAPPTLFDAPTFGLHEHTIDQELRTLCNRHLFATPAPDLKSAEWRLLRRNLRKLTGKIGVVPRASATVVVNHRTAMKRLRFGRGMEIYLRRGAYEKDSYITEMQKLEFYDVENIPIKEDRGIQYRSPVYNAALARHLHNVEPAIYRALLNQDGTPVVAKGFSPLERGLIIDAMASRFRDPMFVLADHSRFDAHVNMELLREEHRTYLRLRGYNRELRTLLHWQEKSKGVTRGGIRYHVTAKRMSGDLNTALGNSVLNWAMLQSFVDLHGLDVSIFLDGDDSLMICERQELPDLAAHCLKYGMATTVEIVDDIHHAEFCQSRLIYTRQGPVMVRNPWKTLDVLTKCPRKVEPEWRAQGVLAATALGELMQAPAVPVICVAASVMARYAGETPIFITPDEWGRFSVYRTDTIIEDVDDTARVELERAWGMTISEQLAIEAHYRSFDKKGHPIRWPHAKQRVMEFDIWDDATSVYEPKGIVRWWRDRWDIALLLPSLDEGEQRRAALLS